MKQEKILLEGPFGRAEIDPARPSLTRLILRRESGDLSDKSLLSACNSDFPQWALGGTSYLVGPNGDRYQSTHSVGHKCWMTSKRQRVQIFGIRPGNDRQDAGPCTENWTFEVTHKGALRWRIDRRFDTPFQTSYHGGPALFFNASPNTGRAGTAANRLNRHGNGLVASFWIAESALNAETIEDYKTRHFREHWFSPCQSATMRSPDGWAIAKIYPSFPHALDLHLAVAGGHLYRRGMYYAFSEFGVSAGPSAVCAFSRGEEQHVVLDIAPVHHHATGSQLMIEFPDTEMQRILQRFFGGLVNAGCLTDCVRHAIGNECDGYLYAGNMHYFGHALLASRPALQPLSSAPFTFPQAYRQSLEGNLTHVDDRGEVMRYYRHDGEFPEISMSNIVGVECDLLYTGDTSVARRHLRTIERMAGHLHSWLDDGVFFAPAERIVEPSRKSKFTNWYYDIVVGVHGYTLYHNAFYFRTLQALETIYTALDRGEQAAACAESRDNLSREINRVFWREDAYGPGSGGYVDWIDEGGKTRAVFLACAQYPLIALGIAPPERARAMLATVDSRLAQLVAEEGHVADATIDNLWPFHPHEMNPDTSEWGGICNGGMLLAITFWEIVARCRSGDVEGAHNLLVRFSRHAAKTNWYEGANGFTIRALPAKPFWEPYLSDQVITATSVIFGFLGVRHTWNAMTVNPSLPPAWESLEAHLVFKGLPHTIIARHGAEPRVIPEDEAP